MHTIIYDMASLNFRWNANRTCISLFSAQSELLAQTDVPAGTSEREGVFLILDAALATTRIKRSDSTGVRGMRRLALYNPYTAQIAVGSIPRTESFGDGKPLEVPLDGLPGRVEDGLLWASDRVLPRLEPDYEAVNKSLAAHQG